MGLACLDPQWAGGRPRRITTDDEAFIVATAKARPTKAGRPFTHGFEFYLERATLAFEFANLGGQGHVAMPLSVILPDGTVERPELGAGDPIASFTDELAVAVEAVASGVPSPSLSGELARQALRLCHAEIESVKTRGTVSLA